MKKMIVDVDLLKVYEKNGKAKTVLTILAWGDTIQVGEVRGEDIPVVFNMRVTQKDGSIKHEDKPGFVSSKAKFREVSDNDIVKYSVVDVEQGDGSVLETPSGKIIFIDGGDNELFARYLASRYKDTSADKPLEVDAMIVTHGDADHFVGLKKIYDSEKNEKLYKRLFIHPKRVYHNGIIKRPKTDDPKKIFGTTIEDNGKCYMIDLTDDLLNLKKEQMNIPFQGWVAALKAWQKRGAIKIKRLSNKNNDKAFDFLASDKIQVEVLGPLEEKVNNNPALPLLHNPPKFVPETEGQSIDANVKLSKSYSASHTINGHSLVLRVTYGNLRLFLSGDINEESEMELVRQAKDGRCNLVSEFLKTPHHGSADFSPAFLEQVNPVLSVISSGDENERKEYVHPTATLVGALGRYSRLPKPLIFVTEMVAFFKTIGWSKQIDKKGNAQGQPYFAFKRTAYGIVNLRFNKERMLVFTHTGKRDTKESYAFSISSNGTATFENVKQV